MNIGKLALLSLTCAGVCACGPKIAYRVGAVPAGAPVRGMVYTLPKTVLLVEIDVQTTTVGSAPVYSSLNEALGLPPASAPAGGSVFKAVRVLPTSVPDASARFLIKPGDKKTLIDRTVEFTFTEEGYVTSSTSTMTDRRLRVAVASFETTASIAAKALGFVSPGAAAVAPLAPGACAGSLPGPLSNEKKEHACKSRDRLFALVNARDAMATTKVANVPADAYTAMLKTVDEEISQISKLFFYGPATSTHTWRFRVEPAGTPDTCFVLSSDKVAKAPCGAAAPTQLKVTLPGPPPTTCAANDSGLVYRLPAEHTYTAEVDGLMMASGSALFPQLGVCAIAPNEVDGGNGKLVVGLSRDTGMLTSLTLVSESVDVVGAIEAAGTSVDSILDAAQQAQQRERENEQEAEEKEAAANDPVSAKKKQLELLELDRQIACYDRLGEPCPAEDSSGE